GPPGGARPGPAGPGRPPHAAAAAAHLANVQRIEQGLPKPGAKHVSGVDDAKAEEDAELDAVLKAGT
ncbi:MAG: hypothetical protein AB1941_31050, partial [Gemmatimonadota bacterium]